MGDHYEPKLTDFGLSILHSAGTTTMGSRSGHSGTLRFMAPEFFNHADLQASFATDIYAFGCLCIEVSDSWRYHSNHYH